MEHQNFEEQLTRMTKPEVPHLKHQDMLANTIIKAKDRSVLSWWWLAIPLYLIAALLMKSIFMPRTTLVSNIHEYASKERYSSLFFFVAIPLVFIVLNFLSLTKIYFLAGKPKAGGLLQLAWFNILMIALSVIILIIYFL